MKIRGKALGSLVLAIAAVAACSSSTRGTGLGAAGTDDGYGAADDGHGASAGSGGRSPIATGGAGAGTTDSGGTSGEPGAHGGAGATTNGGAGATAGASSAGMSSAGNGGAPNGEAGSGEAGSDAAGSGGAGGAAEPSRELFYLSRVFYQDHSGVLLGSVDLNSGKPTLLPESPVNPNSSPISLAVDPAGAFLYTADELKRIDTYRIGPDGALPAQPDSSITTPDLPISLTLDPKGRFAYAASREAKALYAYKIDAATGALSAIGQPVSVGSGPDFSAPTFIAADPSGNFLYVSQATELGLRGYHIDQTSGALDEIAGSPFATIDLPAGDIVIGGAIVFKPSGNFLYSSGGALNAFAVAANGRLDLVPGSPFSVDVQSDQNAPDIAMDPQGEYLYATHFLGSVAQQHLSGFAINQTSGALTEVPGSPLVTPSPYSVAVDASGRFVFVGVDDPGKTSVYSLARADGKLTEIDGSPFPFGGLEPKLGFAARP